VDAFDRYTVSGTGYALEGRIHHAAGSTPAIEDAILPYLVAGDASLVDGRVVGDPTEGELDAALRELGVSLVFAELKDPVRRKVERYGLARTFDARCFHPTVEAAVEAFRSDSGTDWAPAHRATGDQG
jgi:hypothetical protein